MRPLFTAESMIGPAGFSFARAWSLSPAFTAFTTPLMAVRSLERPATLRARRLIVCLARFSADLILATVVKAPKRRTRILPIRAAPGKGEVRAEPQNARKWLRAYRLKPEIAPFQRSKPAMKSERPIRIF